MTRNLGWFGLLLTGVAACNSSYGLDRAGGVSGSGGIGEPPGGSAGTGASSAGAGGNNHAGTSGVGGASGSAAGGNSGSNDWGFAGGAGECPEYETPAALGFLPAPASDGSATIEEASGVCASRLHDNVLWTHNDKGHSAQLFAVTTAGELVAAIDFGSVDAQDWEDIAIGPGPESGVPYLYVGDIGDNAHMRPEVVVYRIAEPTWSAATELPVRQSVVPAALRFRYPDGQGHNAEALLSDPLTGDLYVVTKMATGESEVYRAAAPHDAGVTRTFELVRRLNFSLPPLAGAEVTGGDISPAGDRVLVRTYSTAFLWTREPDQTMTEALARAPCTAAIPPFETNGEAIGFAADDSGYFTLSEGVSSPIYYFAERR